MNQKEMNQNTEGFQQASRLRAEAEAIEAKERVRQWLLRLIELSEDAYYDQYLGQMLRDLESGKATPGQVRKEADRTYRLYQERRSKGLVAGKTAAPVQKTAEPVQKIIEPDSPGIAAQKKDAVEFKIGAGIFSIVGGVFVLAALVIFGFHFLEGLAQGICLYIASLAVLLISELVLRKKSQGISLVITGIGIGSLYISTVVNYLVLKNMNGLMAALITAVIAIIAVFISRKRDAASIRLLSVFGCYISFLPVGGYESELSFLIVTIMLFLINLVSVFFPNQKNEAVIGVVHMIVHTLFCGVITAVLLWSEMQMMYGAFFLVMSLVLLQLTFFRQRGEIPVYSTVIFSVCLGFFVLYLSCVGFQDYRALAYRLLTEIMALAAAFVFFLLWGKDRRRWISFYFMAFVIIFFNIFSGYKIETTIGSLALFIVVKLLSKKKELTVLDCIVTVVTALEGIYMVGSWQFWLFALVLLCSVFFIRRMAVFHEIVLTLFGLIGFLGEFDSNWTLPGSAFLMLLLFLLFNHLPVTKGQKQLPYNIVNTVLASCLYFCCWFCDDIGIHSVMALVGTVAILVMFRERYHMRVPKKYLILAGFLSYMILSAHFETSVLVSSLLMAVALGCVAVGFWVKDKTYRLCGLVVAILVCVKLVVYDFRELSSLPKAILFFTVGILALGISFLYIFLEKKENAQEEIIKESGTVS